MERGVVKVARWVGSVAGGVQRGGSVWVKAMCIESGAVEAARWLQSCGGLAEGSATTGPELGVQIYQGGCKAGAKTPAKAVTALCCCVWLSASERLCQQGNTLLPRV